MFKLQIPLNCTIIPENEVSERVVVILIVFEVNWLHVTHILANVIIDSIHTWLEKG